MAYTREITIYNVDDQLAEEIEHLASQANYEGLVSVYLDWDGADTVTVIVTGNGHEGDESNVDYYIATFESLAGGVA